MGGDLMVNYASGMADKSIVQSRIFLSSMVATGLATAAAVFSPGEIGVVPYKLILILSAVSSAAAAFWRAQDHTQAKREGQTREHKAMP